jgi:hypothetical protein
MTGGEVVEDVGEDFFLGASQIEGESFEKLREQRALPGNNGCLTGGLPRALPGEDALHFEKFFAGEVGAGGFEFFP